MKNLLLTISVLSALVAEAQDYVVTLKNDTIRGKTTILTYDILDRVQVAEGKKKKQFTAVQIKSAFADNGIYQPVRTDNGYRMMKLVKPGFLSLYLARGANPLSYEVEYLVRRDGSALEVPNLLGFKKSMTWFLGDCEVINEQLENGELGRKNLDQIISIYNQCMNDQTKPSGATDIDDPKLVALSSFRTKLESSQLASKKDVLEILVDIYAKVQARQPVPNYQLEGLKGMLKDSPEYQADLEKLLSLLQGP